ncbi:restriction endonuclease [Alicyclobacillus fastidiosus]|uniref:Restriction endonuclease n=1 Tax=Alicyclobacillus fastidiosus TaxID=392011 RepID=A0ABY6ZNJ8_9BACL|nr:restriction endonuclease [Alicyclobacillus fastidiosus]WAH44417.1 restriction endonuclease [Alicyclobacillus fastidiosus]GMA60757.1 hypothetical protein GCM10025859_11970 [Alicyclobacillus fastidiosus]
MKLPNISSIHSDNSKHLTNHKFLYATLVGLYTEKILVECKFWNTKIKRANIDAMVAQMQDLNASKAVFFTVKGCQSGAQTMARHAGIEVFLVREPKDEEWGGPGPVVDFYLQVISRSFKEIQFPGISAFTTEQNGTPQGLNLNLLMGSKTSGRTSTPTVKPDGPGKTFEEMLDEGTLNAVKEFFSNNSFTINQGEECTRYIHIPTTLNFSPPVHITLGPSHIIVPAAQVSLGVRIDQSRIVVDRRKNFLYALVVEDVVRKGKFYASRRNDASNSLISQATEQTPEPNEPELQKWLNSTRLYGHMV